MLLSGDALYVVDLDNGLYQYSLSQEAYVRFYPAHRGPMSQPYVPQRVQSPDGVIPLYHPIAVALTPAGKVMVQEHVTGRVSILVEGDTAPCPLVGDFDCDGEVTVADIMAVAAHWGKRLGDAGYAPHFDLDRDGDTDVVDVMQVAARWGK